MNVDIFACIHFREYEKIGNFAKINIRVSIIIMLYVSIYKLFFRCIYFRGFLENANKAKICTARKCLLSQYTALGGTTTLIFSCGFLSHNYFFMIVDYNSGAYL